MLLILECALVLIAIATAFSFPQLATSGLLPIERRFAEIAQRRKLSVTIIGATALGLRLLFLPITPIPDPAIHDEFSYLLAADTFAHGRLTNPTHPMWIHFETFHEIQNPTYASMYYPAQGLFLALGQVVFGNPFWGVWLSTGLMCAAIVWMLQGWLAPPWALLGGLLAVIRLGTFSYWMNSYYGGSVAALGGALVLGALPRVKRHQRLLDIAIMGLGFAIIANSRPYEGLFFFIAVMAGFLFWMRGRNIPTLDVCIRRIVLPLAGLLIFTACGMGYYFWKVTGSPFRTPFQVNIATYSPVPYFPWQAIRNIPVYHHPVMQAFYLGWWMRQYELGHSHPLILLLLKNCVFWIFFFGPLLTFPIFILCFVLPYGVSFREFGRHTQFLLAVCCCVLFGALLPVYFNPHYVAPITCAIYALTLIAMRNVRRWKPQGRPVGIAMVRSIPAIAILMLILCVASAAMRNSHIPQLLTWYSPIVVNSSRSGVISQLSQQPGLHLIIVQYRPDHDPINEWVFNSADIDHSKIVWARDMGLQQNLELIRYFKDRKIWLIQPDLASPALAPYPEHSNLSTRDLGNYAGNNLLFPDSQPILGAKANK